ncbi:general secretion pathway protein GspF [Hylemonella gracilis str. Niagara R]|uniref:General secretion pathway protein GspF n=1 Tax=Hylemonella gracilis str. Niagara R TaxID=1458275 RepID=A0A016XIR4_9BURK|nr:type II secretion system inner membrane protein GspF [Hylemonella gracilis]EYC51063.1 general secretion pathway protein GspF [Hylemonella gracilis str. Niagara R]
MPAYSYEAVDAQGRSQRGVLQADAARAVRAQLRALGLTPLRVDLVGGGAAASGGATSRFDWRRKTFNASELAVWTRQLAGLVDAGLPLERALASLAQDLTQDSGRPEQQRLIAQLRDEVNGGSTFARALGQHPRTFDESYVAVISAGEQGGQLGAVLERLADELDGQEALRGKLIGAALYPLIVSGFSCLIVAFLLTYVVPQVANAFSSGNRALPALTVFMLALSAFLRAWGWALLLLMAAAAATVYALRQQEGPRRRMDALWLRLPVLGRLAVGYNAARFAATLALLANAGVPILRALQTAADTLHNRALRADAQTALHLVREGAPLAAALAAQQRFPGLLTVFARLGEQTGQLPAMLQRAAGQLGADVQRRALRLATLLEPLLIVGMGLIVMLIVLAVMMPIVELNQLVR